MESDVNARIVNATTNGLRKAVISVFINRD